MSARKVVFAVAGTATGALLLIGAKGVQGGHQADTGAGQRTAQVTGEATAPGSPVPGDYMVTGSVVETPFGPVQVRVHFSNGRIVDVVALQTPSLHQFSVELNKFATPTLRTEALTAQSAKIDVVSGATYTSDAYAQSLQSTIDKAAAGQHD